MSLDQKECEYIVTEEIYGWRFYGFYEKAIPLNRTGKCKVIMDQHGNRHEYVQHRYRFFFTKWVPVDLIQLRKKPVSKIYDCDDLGI